MRARYAMKKEEKAMEEARLRKKEEDYDSDSSLEGTRRSREEEVKAAKERMITEEQLGEAEEYLFEVLTDPKTSPEIKETIERMIKGARHTIAFQAAQDDRVEEHLALDPMELLSDEIQMALDEGADRVGWTDLSFHKKFYKKGSKPFEIGNGTCFLVMH